MRSARTARHATAFGMPPLQSSLHRYARDGPVSTPSPPSHHCSATPSPHRTPPSTPPASSSRYIHPPTQCHTPTHVHGTYPDTPPPEHASSATPPVPPPAPAF